MSERRRRQGIQEDWIVMEAYFSVLGRRGERRTR